MRDLIALAPRVRRPRRDRCSHSSDRRLGHKGTS